MLQEKFLYGASGSNVQASNFIAIIIQVVESR